MAAGSWIVQLCTFLRGRTFSLRWMVYRYGTLATFGPHQALPVAAYGESHFERVSWPSRVYRETFRSFLVSWLPGSSSLVVLAQTPVVESQEVGVSKYHCLFRARASKNSHSWSGWGIRWHHIGSWTWNQKGHTWRSWSRSPFARHCVTWRHCHSSCVAKGGESPIWWNLEGKCDYIDLHFECLCKNVDNSIFNPEICDNYIIISKKGTVTWISLRNDHLIHVIVKEWFFTSYHSISW